MGNFPRMKLFRMANEFFEYCLSNDSFAFNQHKFIIQINKLTHMTHLVRAALNFYVKSIICIEQETVEKDSTLDKKPYNHQYFKDSEKVKNVR